MALVENGGGYEDGRFRVSEATAGDFVALLKPRVMSLVVFTAFVGLLAAPVAPNPLIAVIAILSIAVGAGASRERPGRSTCGMTPTSTPS